MRPTVRASWAALLVLPLLILGLAAFAASQNTPSPAAVNPHAEQLAANRATLRVMQAIYQVEAQAARAGWTPVLQREAGDLWRSAGNVRRAAFHWQAALAGTPQDTELLRSLAGAYLEVEQWASTLR